ncbi:MAG: hypothetical protein IIY94_00540 [Oscillospiraceae bacterium]|nr:hypothetical protein [Oscillospiraceae bacterium]
MKKATFLLLAIFVLLLAGCEKDPEGNARTSEDTTATAAPYVLQLDPADRSQSIRCLNFVETNEGCYYGWQKSMNGGNGWGDFIYFCPRGEATWYPLCNKPNCQHKDKNCNAYIGGYFGYYDGALYTTDDRMGSIDVVKMNLDGTDHQVVANVKLKQRGGYEWMFHHGKFLLRSNNFNFQIEEMPDYLIILDLADGSQTEPLDEYLQTEKLPTFFDYYYKEKVFGYGQNNDPSLTEFDMATGEIKKRDIGNITGFYATDSILYYYLPKENEVDGKKLEAGFWEYDLESETAKYCGLPAEDIAWISYDEDYIYAGTSVNPEEDEVLYILSRDYKVIDRIELEKGCNYAAAASDRLYFATNNLTKLENYYVDKSQIGSGNLQLIPMDVVG